MIQPGHKKRLMGLWATRWAGSSSLSSAIRRRGSLREGGREPGAALQGCLEGPSAGSTPLQDVEVSMGSANLTQPTWFHTAYCPQNSTGISV